MMKQSKNKKGRLAKSTLSVILATSMVLTSSSFVWASPVIEEVEPTAIIEDVEFQNNDAEVVGAAQLVIEGDNSWGTQLSLNGGGSADWYVTESAALEGTKVGTNSANYTTTMDNVGKYVYAVDSGDPSTKSELIQVTKKELTDADVTIELSDSSIEYTGNEIKPTVLSIKDVQSTPQSLPGFDLDKVNVSWNDNTDASTNAKVVIDVSPNDYYTGTLTEKFTITAYDIASAIAKINNQLPDQVASTDVKAPVTSITFTKSGKDLTVEGSDKFTFEYSDSASAGTMATTGTKTINKISVPSTNTNFTGAIDSTGSITGNKTFDVVPANVTASAVLNPAEYTYGSIANEDTITNNLTVKVGNDTLTKGSNGYKVSFPDDWNTVGSKTITIEGTGSYKFTTTTSYTVKPAAVKIDESAVSLTGAVSGGFEYTTDEVKPKISITGYTDAKEGTDYELSYKNNINVYTKNSNVVGYETEAPQVIITFKGSLEGAPSVIKRFKITPFELEASNVSVTATDKQKFTYNGEGKLPAIGAVTCAMPGKTVTLTEGKDFEVVPVAGATPLVKGEAVNVGDYSVKLVGIGNYSSAVAGFKTLDFSIEAKEFSLDTIDVKTNTMAWTGSPVEPVFTLADKETDSKLVKNTDYTMLYLKDNGLTSTTFPTEKGTYKVRLTAAGTNYKAGGIIETSYTIGNDTLAAAIVELNHDSFEYDHTTGQVPVVSSVKINGTGTPLVAGTAYEVIYPKKDDCKNVGTYTITINGRGKYAGESINKTFEITAKEITDSMVKSVVSELSQAGYTAPYATIEDGTGTGKYTLVEDKDYTMSVDTTAKTVTITGKGNYKSDKPITKAYTSNDQMSIANPAITVEFNKTYVFDGKAKRPEASEVIVKDSGVVLTAGRDYTLGTATNNTNAGTAQLTINGSNRNYTGSRTVEFTIEAAEITTAYKVDATKAPSTIAIGDTKASVDGKIKTATGFITTVPGAVTSSSDYDLEYLYDGKATTTFANAGDYTVNIKGRGNYQGTLSAAFHINGTQISTVASVGAIADQGYTGKAIEPVIAVTSKTAGITLVEGTDYTVSYKNNTDIGEAFAIVTGKGKYEGTILASFNIKGVDISDAAVTVDGSYTYTGKAIIPTVTVKVGDTVIGPANYDVVATDNTNAGTAKFTVTGKNNCTGTTKEATFEIGKADQKLAVSKTITAALKVRNTNANTYTLKVTGAETKLTYKSSNTKIATVNSAGKISFKHVCGKANITVTAAADDNHNAATLKVAVAVKPATPKITITARTKGFNAKSTAVKDITGYQVGYSTDKNFAASKTTKKLVTTTKALNKNFSGLSAKKGYYVRVRAYKKVGSTVYWGNWTSAKKITTK